MKLYMRNAIQYLTFGESDCILLFVFLLTAAVSKQNIFIKKKDIMKHITLIIISSYIFELAYISLTYM